MTKKELKLDKAWSFTSLTRSIDFPAGKHEVDQEVYDQALADGVIKEDKANGGGTAEAGAPRTDGPAKG